MGDLFVAVFAFPIFRCFGAAEILFFLLLGFFKLLALQALVSFFFAIYVIANYSSSDPEPSPLSKMLPCLINIVCNLDATLS
tara:strand:- start:455 stop:700 length:246 start_codon:yes stop_codon:yes gene_type:complete